MMSSPKNLPKFDPSAFKNDAYVKRYDKPWGHELHWVTADAPYMGKLLHLKAGHRFSLQLHDQKQESWFVISGRVLMTWDDKSGSLVETELETGKGYSIVAGQRHRMKAITDAVIIEVSTPESGTTWRLEDDYSRPDETPEQRQLERN
jgi:mannose-6-phosphate isomerase